MFISGEGLDLPQVPARKAARDFSGFWEGLSAGFKAEQMETDAWNRKATTTNEVFDDLEAKLRGALGDDEVNAALAAPKHREQPAAAKARRQEALLGLAKKSGDTSLPWTLDAVEERSREQYRAEYDDAVETLDYMRGGRGVAEFFGRGGAGATDPLSLALIPLGGGTGSVARIIAREALLGAAGEAGILPRQYEMAEYLDIEDPNAAAQIGMGALFGGALGGAGVALTRAGRRQISNELARALEYARGRHATPRAAADPISAKASVDDAEDAMTTEGPLVLRPEDRVLTDESPRPWEQEGDPGVAMQEDAVDPVEVELNAEVSRLREETGGRTRPVASWMRGAQDADGVTFQIHPDGPAAAELRARGITPRTMPGLFSRAGRKSFDNLVPSEMEEMFPGITEEAGVSGPYLDEMGFLGVLVDELNGTPRLRNNVDLTAAEADLEAYLRMREARDEVFDPLPETDDVSELQDGLRRIGEAVDDFARQAGVELSEGERGDVVQALAERGGSVGDALDAMEGARLRAIAEEIDDGTQTGGRPPARDDAGDAGEPRGSGAPAGDPRSAGAAPAGSRADPGPDRAARAEGAREAGLEVLLSSRVIPEREMSELEAEWLSIKRIQAIVEKYVDKPEAAKARIETLREMQREVMRKKLPDRRERVDILAKQALIIRTVSDIDKFAPLAGARPGKVQFDKDIDPWEMDVIQAVTDAFGIDVDIKVHRNFDIVGSSSGRANAALNLTQKMFQRGGPTIQFAIKKQAKSAKAVETILHELGHVLHVKAIADSSPTVIAGLIQGWVRGIDFDVAAEESFYRRSPLFKSREAKWYSRSREMMSSTDDFTRISWESRRRWENIDGVFDGSRTQDYFYSFREWFADQAARYMEADEQIGGGIADRLFAKMAQAWRAVIDRLQAMGFVDTSIRNALDPLRVRRLSEATSAGDQLLVDGVDPITERNRLESQMQSAMRGGSAEADFGLFDLNARDQMDMFSEGGATKEVDAVNVTAAQEMREAIEADGSDFTASIQMEDGSTRSMSASQWLDELDAEEDFTQIAEICAPNRGGSA